MHWDRRDFWRRYEQGIDTVKLEEPLAFKKRSVGIPTQEQELERTNLDLFELMKRRSTRCAPTCAPRRQIKEDHMKRRKTIACAVAAAITLVTSIAHSQTKNSQSNKADQQFMNEAIQGDLSEINMGKLAQQKGESQGIKQFGQMLEQDHGQHLQQARGTAQQLGLTAPTQANAKQKQMYDRLSKLSSAQFDKQFAQEMVNDHKEDIAAYQKEAKAEGPLADFALQTVPTLQKHLQTAQSLTGQERSQQ